MTISDFTIVLILLLCSCTNDRKTISIDTVNSRKASAFFSNKPDRYYYTYDTSKSEMKNWDSGYIDTFSVAGIKFQLFSNPDSSGDLELQVMKNGNWKTNLKFSYGINGNEATSDFNRDGFNDFVCSLLRGNAVYFFDSINKEFHAEPVSFAFKWSIIDSSQNLYSNYYSSHDVYETDLFKLDGFQQTFYYTAPISYEIGESKEIASYRVYKVLNNDLEDTVFVFVKKFDLLEEQVDYRKFWLDIIKQNGNLW